MLHQVNPIATTETVLYTVPTYEQAVVPTMTVCNIGLAATFRISVSPAGAATATADYLYYDLAIPANDSFEATLGLALQSTDVVRVYASSANLAFQLTSLERDDL